MPHILTLTLGGGFFGEYSSFIPIMDIERYLESKGYRRSTVSKDWFKDNPPGSPLVITIKDLSDMKRLQEIP